jgi:hypothetical protein
MGYRGSKSNFIHKFVKEQRVDGSWYYNSKLKYLRCTLMDLERGYQVGIPSKLTGNRFISTSVLRSHNLIGAGNIVMNPLFITGFTDAEGSFTVSMYPDKTRSTGIKVNAEFKIGLNVQDYKDKVLLQIQSFFGGIGLIHYSSNSVTFRVNNLIDLLNVIIPHFMKYLLLSVKYADFKLFVQIIHLLNEKAHLNEKGLQQIVNIQASLKALIF